MKASTGLLILKNLSIRWSAPSNFNDPFDIPSEIFKSFSRPEFQKILAERLIQLARDKELRLGKPLSPSTQLMLTIYDGSNEHMKKEIEAAYLDPDTEKRDMPQSFQILRSMWKGMHNTHRVLCLTERWDSASMWDRYSEEHKGIVLEFSCIEQLDSAWLAAEPIKYSDEELKAHTLEGFVDFMLCDPKWAMERMIKEISYTKTTDWAYEKEWRIASYKRPNEEGTFSDYGFDERELKSIILGKETNQKTKDQIYQIVSQNFPNTEIWKAIIENGRKLKRERIR